MNDLCDFLYIVSMLFFVFPNSLSLSPGHAIFAEVGDLVMENL